MIYLIFLIIFAALLTAFLIWFKSERSYSSSKSVADAYDNWTEDSLLEALWGDHIHLGFYEDLKAIKDFRKAKIDFVHELVKWSGMDKLPRGSRILDVGCGIGGSSRILAKDYGFEVIGITISPGQVKRANELTHSDLHCNFQVMDALSLSFEEGSFDGVWSVEAGPHMPDKQKYADEMLRVLRPGGVLAVADWNRRDMKDGKYSFLERIILRQLLNQWAHPEFSSIKSFTQNLSSSSFSGGFVEADDWTSFTLPSWDESILEGFRHPRRVLNLGLSSFFKGLREIPTILLMKWAFSIGLMNFGVFRTRG